MTIMDNNKDFKDIVSDSHLKNKEFVDLSSMSNNYKSRRYKKKKHGIAGFFSNIGESISKWWRKAGKLQKTAVISLTSVIAVLLAGIIFVSTYFNYNYNKITDDNSELGFEEVIDKNVMNIALFGIDSRSQGFKGNSDSIMVLSLNFEKKEVKIVSIMRDSLVKIDKNGKTTYNKINSAYAYGGPELAIKTINENFGLDISEYATVNFEGMMDIIDAVGGIDAELTDKEVVRIEKNHFALNAAILEMCTLMGENPEKHYIYTPGKHHLNGIQAVAYSRIRKVPNVWGTNNDYGRTDRQRYVMEQLFNKAITLNKSNYIKLAKSLIPCSETSLSYSEIIGLATGILLKSPTFQQSRIPLDQYQMSTPNISGVGSCVYYDLNYASKVLHAFLYDDIKSEDYIEQNGVEKNDWYKNRNNTSSGNGSSSKSTTSSSKPSTSSTKPATSSSDKSTVSSVNSSSDTSSTSSVVTSSDKEKEEKPQSSDVPSSSETEKEPSDKEDTDNKDNSTDKDNSADKDDSSKDTSTDTEKEEA